MDRKQVDFGREKEVFPLVLIQVKSAAKRTVFDLKNKREKTFLPFKTQLFHIQVVRYAASNYKVKISLPEEMVTIDQTSDKVITVYRDYTFSSLGTGTFKSAAMAEEGEDFATWEVEVQKADQISWYKAMNLYEKGYNIVFKVNEANEVTVESQPAWKHASYGEVFVSGKGALEDGVITVKLSHDVPNVGGFGEFKEILYLPAK